MGYISLYSGIGFALHYAFTDKAANNATSLWIGLGLIALGGIILLLTPTPTAANNRRDALDWWDILDWLELPFELLIWIFKGIFKIFD